MTTTDCDTRHNNTSHVSVETFDIHHRQDVKKNPVQYLVPCSAVVHFISDTSVFSFHTDQEPGQKQITRRKWSRMGDSLRRNNDNIAKQDLQRKPQGHRRRGRPRNI